METAATATVNGGGRPDDMMHEPEMFDADDAEIISPAELTQVAGLR